ncbi:MAG: pyridoxamine 5'-phosphate oxidase family protein [Pseudolabrys sp.]
MSEGFTIANFRSVAHGLQEGQFAVGERKKASGLRDLDPKYKRLLDEPVTMTLGLIGLDERIGLTPMWFDYEGDKILVNTASHRHKCEWIRKNPRLTILLVNPNNPYHWVQIKCTVEKEMREWEPGGEYVTKQLDRIWTKYTGKPGPYALRDPKIDEKRVLFVCGIDRIATANRDLRRKKRTRPAGCRRRAREQARRCGLGMKKGYVALFQFAESFNIVGSHWDDEGRKQDDYEQHKRRRFCHRHCLS